MSITGPPVLLWIGAAAAAIIVATLTRRTAAKHASALRGSITFLYSSRFATSRKFYEEDLGLRVRCDRGAVVFYALPGRGASLGIVKEGVSAAANPPCSTATAGRDSVMVCLLTDDVDSCFRHITMQGRCTVEQAPKRIERFGIYNALVRDPDGYLVEIQRFLNPGEQAEFSS